MSDAGFLFLWVYFGIFLLLSMGLFFLFGKRCGMLDDQDRARHLALWACIRRDDEPEPGKPEETCSSST